MSFVGWKNLGRSCLVLVTIATSDESILTILQTFADNSCCSTFLKVPRMNFCHGQIYLLLRASLLAPTTPLFSLNSLVCSWAGLPPLYNFLVSIRIRKMTILCALSSSKPVVLFFFLLAAQERNSRTTRKSESVDSSIPTLFHFVQTNTGFNCW